MSYRVCRSFEGDWVEMAPGVRRKVLTYGDELMYVKFRLEKGSKVPVHSHPHAQASYLLEGALRFQVGEDQVDLGVGDSIFFSPGEPHGVVEVVEDSTLLEVFSPKRDDFLR